MSNANVEFMADKAQIMVKLFVQAANLTAFKKMNKSNKKVKKSIKE